MFTVFYPFAILLSCAILVDMIFGDPQCFRLHPVRLVGSLIARLERLLYADSFGAGALLAVATVSVTVFSIHLILRLTAMIHPNICYSLGIFFIWASIGWRSLKDETAVIKAHLLRGDITSARASLARVVGRDTDLLDDKSIVRAAVETVGENAIDGIISPIFWAAVGAFVGLPVEFAWAFKAISTLDSSVGYKNDRYRSFGTFSARADDVVNFIPARIGTFFLVLADAITTKWFTIAEIRGIMRDRLAHSSPNSAHGEAVMAWRLGIALGGGSYYRGVFVEKPTLGRAIREPEPDDISRSHEIIDRGTALFILFVFAALRLLFALS